MKKRRFMNSNPTDVEKKLFQHLGLYLANEKDGISPVDPEYVQMNGIASDGFPARIEAAVAERCVHSDTGESVTGHFRHAAAPEKGRRAGMEVRRNI